jgi:hypothetical protein
MTENTTASQKDKAVWDGVKYLVLLAVVLPIVLLLWWGCYKYTVLKFAAPEGCGEAGDLFGSVNALFSGMAFSVLIVTLLMQREELGLQRRELTASIREQERQAKALDAQVEIMAVSAQLAALPTMIDELKTRLSLMNKRVYGNQEIDRMDSSALEMRVEGLKDRIKKNASAPQKLKEVRLANGKVPNFTLYSTQGERTVTEAPKKLLALAQKENAAMRNEIEIVEVLLSHISSINMHYHQLASSRAQPSTLRP